MYDIIRIYYIKYVCMLDRCPLRYEHVYPYRWVPIYFIVYYVFMLPAKFGFRHSISNT